MIPIGQPSVALDPLISPIARRSHRVAHVASACRDGLGMLARCPANDFSYHVMGVGTQCRGPLPPSASESGRNCATRNPLAPASKACSMLSACGDSDGTTNVNCGNLNLSLRKVWKLTPLVCPINHKTSLVFNKINCLVSRRTPLRHELNEKTRVL